MSQTSRFLDAHPWALGMSFDEAMRDPRYVEDGSIEGGALRQPCVSPTPSDLDSQLLAAPDVCGDEDATGRAA